ncbi:N-acetylglucosamine-specific PTS transporter subunit IIBC [Abiotrophia defectiva]|uniref:N-acetylglucosamine-specific PTS transporter subunit IIBC n=1 Tax=Abiotrophia defectiva TaxID=46125 RepID=UPI0028E4C4EC|nr:N-acetylglucosamine-specific PTS transporter subunit IIBC [Abiotrophia defectiva]
MSYLQKMGRSLMLPVAVLPVASILMGIGYWISPAGLDASGSPVAAFLIQAGLVLIDNIPLLFAVGLAVGLAKDKNGAAGLSGLVAFLIITKLLSKDVVAQLQGVKPEEVALAFTRSSNAFIGILSGIIGGEMYNRFKDVKLPTALGFFSGRRAAPIMSGILASLTALVLLFVWPTVFSGLVAFGKSFVGLGAIGAGIYGFFNRLLIPVGLHHALNAVFWFDVAGIDDIKNFWQGIGELGQTGMYQAGFFPVMMFGLPGAALAMYRNAKDSKKKAVSALLVAAVLASFLTGITEPLEFSFMFLAPVLYLVHAVLTGVSLTIAALLHTTAGFNFSAGLIDFILASKTPMANNPWLLIVLGVVMFAVYFLVFDFLIKKFNFTTPGREDDESTEGDANMTVKASDFNIPLLIEGLGGKDNIEATDHCATRLRLTLADTSKVDEAKIKSTGAVATRILNKKNVQVIIGTEVQFVHDALAAQVK